jgi:hypothetical protein
MPAAGPTPRSVDTTPVIIGVGHVTHRAGDLDATLEPAELVGRAIDEARSCPDPA